MPDVKEIEAPPAGWTPVSVSCRTVPCTVAKDERMATSTAPDADAVPLTLPAASIATATVWDCRSEREKVIV